MLRALVALLLLANLAFFGWTQGWLDDLVGVRAIGDREPERLTRQIRPEALVILPPAAASAAASTAGSTACLEAGPYLPADAAAAESALQGQLPAGSWTAVRSERPGSWIIYMGRFDTEGLQKKEGELKRLRLEFEPVRTPAALDLGLSLGRYDVRADAERALAVLTQRGVRTARVVEISAPSASVVLRVERADPALAARVEGLGKGFAPCAGTVTAQR